MGWEYVVPLGCVAITAIGNAVYQSQPNAMVQSFFQDERVTPAMANSTLWQSLGFAASFLMSAMLSSLALRIAVLALFFMVSIATAAVLHFRVARFGGEVTPKGNQQSPSRPRVMSGDLIPQCDVHTCGSSHS